MKETRLFGVPIWTVSIDDVLPFHEEMYDEVVPTLVSATTDEGHLGRQTITDPFQLPSAGWGVLDSAIRKGLEQILGKETAGRVGEVHLSRWVIELGALTQAEKGRLTSGAVHNHIPALVSCIYYLSIPSDLEGTEGGTEFHNPLGGLLGEFASRKVYVPAREGMLVFFPSCLDHAPRPTEWDASERTRLTVSCDAFLTSGVGRVGRMLDPADRRLSVRW